ncbi:MAG TPA: hypothetical protein VH638_06775, partial [Gemmatimonadaceae bacterium]
MLLAILNESPLAFARGALAFAVGDVLHRLGRGRLVQLLDKPRVRARSMLPFGVQRSRVSALAHVDLSSAVCVQWGRQRSTLAPREAAPRDQSLVMMNSG